MDDEAAIKKRPGGRSAQVRARVQAAVIELLADQQLGSYRFVRVFETHHVGATAPPVPRDLFTGPRNEFRAYNPENGCLELLPEVSRWSA
ncbi:MAG: hypothetical protein JSU06_03400 [Actinobacteria bacterium]|nr:hypothetical protein [Actinomycetota bacterium]